MKEIELKLMELADEKNADFQAKLAPGISRERCIGTRMPDLRKLAKEISKTNLKEEFLLELPHKYYDEDMLHSVLLSTEKDYARCLMMVERFLPFVDNWASCDTLRPKVFARHKEELLPHIRSWISSAETYTCRFGIDMLMTYYLDEDFDQAYPELVSTVISEEYYVNMMIAWYFATALAKQWDTVIPYIENNRLSKWVHKKTIQKACESFRITSEQKEYLKSYR